MLANAIGDPLLFGDSGDKMGATATGIAVGLNKGHVTTKRELAPRPSNRKGVR